MFSRDKHSYTAIGQLEEVVVDENPAKQRPNGTEHSPRSTAQQTIDNEGQPSTSEQRPNGTEHSPRSAAQHTISNEGQPSTSEQRPNGTEHGPRNAAPHTISNEGQPSTSEQHPNGAEQESIIAEDPVNVSTELHLACQRLDCKRVSFLLEQGSDVNALDEQWLTPLDVVGERIPRQHTSPIESFLRVIKALDAKGGKPTSVKGAKYLETPLHLAVKLACEGCTGCNDCSQCLIAIDILVEAGYKELLMYDGTEYRYVKDAPMPTNKEVYTSLHAAVLKKWFAGAKALLKHGAVVNARVLVPPVKGKHRRGENVLHAAVHKQWPEGVALLIEHNADLDAKLSVYFGGHTALHMASQRVDASCLELLLEAGAHPNTLNSQGLTPLDVVGTKSTNNTAKCFLRVIKALIAKKGEPTSSDNPKYGETPIHGAVKFNCAEAIPILYDKGYKNLLPNKSGNTALHIVTTQKSKTYLDLLASLYKNTGLDARNNMGETALHIAVKGAWLEGVGTLLENGADITIKTYKEETVLHLLPEKRNYVMMETLLNHKDKLKVR